MTEEVADSGGSASERFRWQALFQRVDEPLFVLNRRRAILFVNHAWQRLTGLSDVEARQVVCRRRRPASVADSIHDVLAHLLCPPAEVLHGQSARVRRVLPGQGAAPRWWDVEFFPLCHEARVLGILGRILPLPTASPSTRPPIPEQLLALRYLALRRQEQQLPAGESPAMRRLREQIHLASQVRTSAVLIGEAGVGKKTLARLIHAHGLDHERSFAALDCTRLPVVAVAGLLLGDGGAEQRGQLGTIYLAEPGRLPREVQQILWERMTERDDADAEEGDRERLPRLLAGFCTDPRDQVRSGRLLESFYCSLDVMRLEIPPLRDRLGDLPLLVDRCLTRANADGEQSIVGLTDDAWELLKQHPWPRNLTELFSVLDAARRRAAGPQITAADMPAALRLRQRMNETPGRVAEQSLPLDQLLEQVERRLITLALRQTHGNRSKTAEILGLSRPRLLRRMEALGLSSPAGEDEEK
jgi:transcriptional regulator with AAA-type ATPase domain